MTLQERIDNCEFENNREMLQGLYDAIAGALWIPNEYLPEDLQQFKEFTTGAINKHDGKCFGRSGTDCLKYAQEQANKQEEFNHSAEKERRVELYAAQVADFGEFEYEEEVEFDGFDKLAEKMTK